MRSQQRPTDLVMPLEDTLEAPKVDDQPYDPELDWCFEDTVLNRQLKLVKSGRGVVFGIMGACAAALCAAIVLFTI